MHYPLDEGTDCIPPVTELLEEGAGTIVGGCYLVLSSKVPFGINIICLAGSVPLEMLARLHTNQEDIEH